MKHLSILLLLVFLAPMAIVLAQDETTEEPALSDEEFLGEVNKRRRAFAKKHKIANMHELIWDQSLADAVLTDKQKNQHTTTLNYIEIYTYNEELGYTDIDASNLEGEEVDVLNYLWRGAGNNLLPTNRFVGCHPNIYCYYSPFNDNKFDEILKVKGEPGSKCDNGYGNNDGLCVLLPPTTPYVPTPSAPSKAKDPSESKDKESGEEAATDSEASSSSPLVFYTLSILTSFFLILF